MPNLRNVVIVAAALLAATMPSSIHASGSRALKSSKNGKSAKKKGFTDQCDVSLQTLYEEDFPAGTFKEMFEFEIELGGPVIPMGGYEECGGLGDLKGEDPDVFGECTYKNWLGYNFRVDQLLTTVCDDDLFKIFQGFVLYEVANFFGRYE